LGPDGDLVSAIISTAIIPRLSNLIEGGAFDPFSSKDIRRAVSLAEEVEVSVEKGNYKFQVIVGFSQVGESSDVDRSRCF
jgi:GC-rich sequence DNA-binding factor